MYLYSLGTFKMTWFHHISKCKVTVRNVPSLFLPDSNPLYVNTAV